MGLHPADRDAAARAACGASSTEGNTVVCVEHDPEVAARRPTTSSSSGPGAGAEGGRVVGAGPGEGRARARARPPIARRRRPPRPPLPADDPRTSAAAIRVRGATWRNLRGIDAAFPHAGLTCVTGVSRRREDAPSSSTCSRPPRAPSSPRAPFPARRACARSRDSRAFDRVSVSDGAPSRAPARDAGQRARRPRPAARALRRDGRGPRAGLRPARASRRT